MFKIVFVAMALSSELYASCCAGASSAGIGRLRLHERAYVAFINDAHRVIGSFDREARFHSGQAPHLPHWRFNHELQAMVRVFDYFQPFIKLPARTQLSAIRVGSNRADATLGAHMPLFDEDVFASWPALSLTTALKLPTGVADAQDAENITSMGLYELSLSLMIQKTFSKLTTAMGYGLSFSPAIFMKNEFHHGIAHTPMFALSFLPHELGHMQLTLAPSFFSNARVNGHALKDSSRRQLLASIAYSLMIHSHLTLTTAVGAHLPIAIIAKNSESDIFVQFGIRMGVF